MNDKINIIGGASGFVEIEVEDALIQIKDVNELINNYTCVVRQGDINEAYRIIMTFMRSLQISFAEQFKEFQVSSNMYQGYMDMTFISLTTEALKAHGLKVAIVYVHHKGTFEAWLSGRNRKILEEHKNLTNKVVNSIKAFHDNDNSDAIVEYTLVSHPDFNNQDELTKIIQTGIEKFINTIANQLKLIDTFD